MKTLVITIITVFLYLQTDLVLAQVSKSNTTQGIYNGTSDSRILNFTQSDFGGNTTTIDKVTIAVEFSSQDSGTFGLTFHEDIAFRLVSPSGTEVDLVYDARGIFTGDFTQTVTYGGNDPTSTVTVNFDDSAMQPVFNINPISGTFRPVKPLSVFNNESPIGDWTLLIADSYDNGFDDQLFFFSTTITIETPTLGLVNNTLEDNVKIWPTLIDDYVSINHTGLSINNILVNSINGNKLLELDTNTKTYNFSSLKSGIYFLIINTNKGDIIKKIVKR